MLIMTQNKEAIINLDNVLGLSVDQFNRVIATYETHRGSASKVMGEYSSRNMAVFVLKRVLNNIENDEQTYYMPQDREDWDA